MTTATAALNHPPRRKILLPTQHRPHPAGCEGLTQ